MQLNGRKDTISIDRLKPAHIDDTGITKNFIIFRPLRNWRGSIVMNCFFTFSYVTYTYDQAGSYTCSYISNIDDRLRYSFMLRIFHVHLVTGVLVFHHFEY